MVPNIYKNIYREVNISNKELTVENIQLPIISVHPEIFSSEYISCEGSSIPLHRPNGLTDMPSCDSNVSWAEVEFGEADLGDVRRCKRLIKLAQQCGSAP